MQKEKIRTTVRIAGKDYTIASYDSAEYVNRVAAYVNRKMNELGLATHLPAAQLAVLAAVNATDDMLKSRDEIDRLHRELDGLRTEYEAQREQIDGMAAAATAREAELERLRAALADRGAQAEDADA